MNVHSQINCEYEKGEIYRITKSGVNLRNEPSKNGNIITSLRSENYHWFILEVIDDQPINNYLKVKLEVPQIEEIKQFSQYNDTICWVNTSLIEYNHPIYPIGGTPIEKLDNWVEKYKLLKIRNSCKY